MIHKLELKGLNISGHLLQSKLSEFHIGLTQFLGYRNHNNYPFPYKIQAFNGKK